jgi:hypothetical protein
MEKSLFSMRRAPEKARHYQGQLRLFEEFTTEVYGSPRFDGEAVAFWVQQLAQHGHRLSSIEAALAALGHEAARRGLGPPRAHPAVVGALRAAARLAPGDVQQKPLLTVPLLSKVVEYTEQLVDEWMVVRDKALSLMSTRSSTARSAAASWWASAGSTCTSRGAAEKWCSSPLSRRTRVGKGPGSTSQRLRAARGPRWISWQPCSSLRKCRAAAATRARHAWEEYSTCNNQWPSGSRLRRVRARGLASRQPGERGQGAAQAFRLASPRPANQLGCTWHVILK